MGETRDAGHLDPLRLLALAIARRGRIALLAAGRAHWHVSAGTTFVPIELPGSVQEPEDTPHATADRLARHVLGRSARLIASRQLYGPSAVHRIDRLPAMAVDDEPLPLLRLERVAPLQVATTPTLRRVVVTVYRARLAGAPTLSTSAGDDGAAGLLWLSPDALRLAMRGLAFADLLAQPAVEWQPATSQGAAGERAPVPDDAFAYVPADYGERHLLRLVAKYGPEALFQGDDEG